MATKPRKISPDVLEERKAAAEQLHRTLLEQVEKLATSEGWQAMLAFAATARTRSINNMLLVLAQLPTATRVEGFKRWQELGRQVRAGEKALKIFGYSTRRHAVTDEETGEESVQRSAYFPMLSVFDISQTDPISGEELPDHTQALTGDDLNGIFERTAAVMRGRGWTVTIGSTGSPDINGYATTDGTRQIVIGDHLAPAQRAKTMLHEAAHATLHADDPSGDSRDHRGVIETEAESVAFVLGAMLGLDTSGYSIGYVAGWSGGKPELLRSTAANVMRAVTSLGDELLEERNKAASA